MSKINKDVAAGLLFLAIGLLFLTSGWMLPFGTWRKIGPGGFPTMVAGLLALFGLGIAVKGLIRRSERLDLLSHPRALLAVLGALVVFGLLLQGVGLVAATLASTLVAACAVRPLRLVPMAIYGVLVGSGCSLLFVKALGMQAPVVGPWFGF
ncbi:MAG: tripartite tricarboxylate transporter TctB family protein [Pseudomonadota bacterium]